MLTTNAPSMPVGGLAGYGQARDTIQPVRVSQVQEQVERASQITARLEKKTGSLLERLQGVLADVPQANDASSPKPTLVGHAMSLSNHNDQLENIENAITSILDRLEL